MNFLRRLVWKWKAFVAAKKAWLSNKYFLLFQFMVLKLMLLTNNLMRKYIVMKGKDPDYVAPPPPPPPVPEPILRDKNGREVYYSTRGKSTNINFGFANTMVKKLDAHPVLKSRAALEAKKAAKQVVVTPPSSPPLQVALPVEEPLQVASTEDKEAQEAFQELVNVAEQQAATEGDRRE